MLKKSLYFDFKVATMHELPMRTRIIFLLQKYVALVAVIAKRPSSISVGATRVIVQTIGDIGTLQSCITDVHDELVSTNLLGANPTIMDVGANIGQWTTSVKLFYPAATILSIEPDPEIFKKLQRNVASLTDVETLCCAVGSEAGTSTLFRQKLSGMSTLFPGQDDSRANPIVVPIRTIDEIANGRKIDFLKIDVEGAELEAICGAEYTLTHAGLLLVELNLGRSSVNGITTLSEIKRMLPNSTIIKFGRPLGDLDKPACQDVLIAFPHDEPSRDL